MVTCLLQPGMYQVSKLRSDRHRLRAALGLEDFFFRWIVDYFRLPQPHSILLAEP